MFQKQQQKEPPANPINRAINKLQSEIDELVTSGKTDPLTLAILNAKRRERLKLEDQFANNINPYKEDSQPGANPWPGYGSAPAPAVAPNVPGFMPPPDNQSMGQPVRVVYKRKKRKLTDPTTPDIVLPQPLQLVPLDQSTPIAVPGRVVSKRKQHVRRLTGGPPVAKATPTSTKRRRGKTITPVKKINTRSTTRAG